MHDSLRVPTSASYGTHVVASAVKFILRTSFARVKVGGFDSRPTQDGERGFAFK